MSAKIFIIAGLLLLIIGGVLLVAPGIFRWFGALPGDLSIKGENYSVFIPITSMLLISVILSLILNFLRR